MGGNRIRRRIEKYRIEVQEYDMIFNNDKKVPHTYMYDSTICIY